MGLPAFGACLALLGALLASHPASADCIDYGDYVHWTGGVDLPDQPLSLIVSGGWGYVAAQDSGLVVIDVTDVDKPRIAGTAATPAAALDVAVTNGHAYVAAGDSGLVVIDIADPVSPRVVGRFRTRTAALQVVAAGHHVYVGVQNVLYVLDVANPDQPELKGSVEVQGMSDVTVSGARAYVVDFAWPSSLQVIDISDSRRPRVVGRVELPGSPWALHVGGIAVSGSYAYVADGSYGLQVIDIGDITDSHGPRVVGSVDTGDDYFGVVVSGTLVYAITNCCGGYSGELQVIDVSNPESPSVLATVGILSPPNAIAVQAGSVAPIVFVVDGREGYGYPSVAPAFDAFDVGGSRTPSIVGSCPIANMVRRVAVQGSLAYLTNYSYGVRLINVADPQNPTLQATVDTPGLAEDVAAMGDYACVADGWSGLQVIHMSAWNPHIEGSVSMPGYTDNVAISGVGVPGAFAYVPLHEPPLFAVVDTKDPRAPWIVGSVTMPGFPGAVAISGHEAYVTNHDGLVVVDIADPANPQVVGSLDTPGMSFGVAVAGDYAYVGDLYGIRVVDITDSQDLRIVGELHTSFAAGSVATSGSSLYVIEGVRLTVIDIADPRRPRIIGGGDALPGMPLDVAVSGEYAFVSVASYGLDIRQIQCPPIRQARAEIGIAPTQDTRIIPSFDAGSLTVRLSQLVDAPISVFIYDVAGRRVRELHDGIRDAGMHDLIWDGRDDAGREVATGVYMARVIAAGAAGTTRFVLLR